MIFSKEKVPFGRYLLLKSTICSFVPLIDNVFSHQFGIVDYLLNKYRFILLNPRWLVGGLLLKLFYDSIFIPVQFS